jgi:hypothetical protein
MKNAMVIALLCVLSIGAVAQTQATSAFPSTTYNFNLTPITLPGVKTTASGAETDIKFHPTTNFDVGETTLLSTDYVFVGGRGDYVIPQFSKWLNNISPSLNGYQFELGLTGSLGTVKAFGVSSSAHWGERAGIFLNYAVSGTTGLGVEFQWNNFPGYAHNVPSIAFGPNFHF